MTKYGTNEFPTHQFRYHKLLDDVAESNSRFTVTHYDVITGTSILLEFNILYSRQ